MNQSARIGKWSNWAKEIGISLIVTLIVLGVGHYGNQLLPHQEFRPHGMCYLWYAPLLAASVVCDGLIFAAYTLIPFMLVQLLKGQIGLPKVELFVGFILFIFFCGLTHLMDIITVWHPVYWLALGVKAVTALTSVPTALYLAKLVPQLLAVMRLRKMTAQVAINIESISPEDAAHHLRRLCALLDERAT